MWKAATKVISNIGLDKICDRSPQTLFKILDKSKLLCYNIFAITKKQVIYLFIDAFSNSWVNKKKTVGTGTLYGFPFIIYLFIFDNMIFLWYNNMEYSTYLYNEKVFTMTTNKFINFSKRFPIVPAYKSDEFIKKLNQSVISKEIIKQFKATSDKM